MEYLLILSGAFQPFGYSLCEKEVPRIGICIVPFQLHLISSCPVYFFQGQDTGLCVINFI